MTPEEIVKILGELNNRKYVLHRDLKDASSVARVYKDYIIELWLVDIKDTKNNKCILSVHEIGQWTDRSKDLLVENVESKFIEELLIGVKENRL
ncbi:MAG: hypothetical protein IKX56_02605 [Muribaculaceae bacterium]|nr:hypothetical protein [Muribaculaceae bacterium]